MGDAPTPQPFQPSNLRGPRPDPQLIAQQQQAQQLQVQATQQNVSADTANLLRQFGAASAMVGAGLTTPLSSIAGGFANPPVTASGGMVGSR